LNRKLTPHSMINGNACFAYFNKNWGIPRLAGQADWVADSQRPAQGRDQRAADCCSSAIFSARLAPQPSSRLDGMAFLNHCGAP
jgi:hypothetical protein